MYVVKAAKTTFVQKKCTFNVDEIYTNLDGIVFYYSHSIRETYHVVFATLRNIAVTNIPIQADLVGQRTNPIKSKFVVYRKNCSNFEMSPCGSCEKK